MNLYLCFFLQRAAQQLKAQRQLEEAFESRLQRMQTDMQTSVQTNMQPNVETVTLVSSDTTLSTDTNLSSGKWPINPVLYDVFVIVFDDCGVQFND